MAGLGNRRGSKTSSGSGSARDRVSAAREKMGGGSRRSRPSDAYKEYGPGKREGKRGGKLVTGSKAVTGGKPKKGGYILTESVDNLIGGKFTKKSGPTRAKLATREELLEARKKREEEKSKTGKRMRPRGDREGVAPKRPVREGSPKAGGRKTDVVRERLFKKPGSKSGGVEAFKPSDKARGPVRGPARGNVGPGRKEVGPKRAIPPEDRARIGGNQINNRGPKAGVGQGAKRGGQGPKRSPGQTGGNVGPGGKGPNRNFDYDAYIV